MKEFGLIETILWEKKKYFLLDLHLKRLKKSSKCFAFFYDKSKIIKALQGLVLSFNPKEKYRVRLALRKNGKLNIQARILEKLDSLPIKVAFSDKKLDKNNIFLKHKTTNRSFYDKELAKYRKKGFFDCLFMNHSSEITEGAITNILIQKGKGYLMPPLSSGLLPGVYREYLLNKGFLYSKTGLEESSNPVLNYLPIKEKVLYKKDILSADRVFVINSVRKTLPAQIS